MNRYGRLAYDHTRQHRPKVFAAMADPAALEREFGTDVYEDDIYDPWVDENVLVASNVTQLASGD